MNYGTRELVSNAISVVPNADISDAAILTNLEQHAADARGAYSPNTERAFRADTAVFVAWCTKAGLKPLPASATTVARFVDEACEVKAPATVRRYVSSVGAQHRGAKLADPCVSQQVRFALKRMHKAKPRNQRQAAPLTRRVVDEILVTAGAGLKGLRDRALLTLAYDTLARRSELVALHVRDIEPAADGSGVMLIARSKTDQEGEGMVRYVAPDTLDCIKAWQTAADIQEGALFRTLAAGRVGGALDAGDVARIFKSLARAARVPAETVARISGHSSRVGAAQDMMTEGMELPEVMQAGGWKSAEMVARYTRNVAVKKSAAAKLAVKQNRA